MAVTRSQTRAAAKLATAKPLPAAAKPQVKAATTQPAEEPARMSKPPKASLWQVRGTRGTGSWPLRSGRSSAVVLRAHANRFAAVKDELYGALVSPGCDGPV